MGGLVRRVPRKIAVAILLSVTAVVVALAPGAIGRVVMFTVIAAGLAWLGTAMFGLRRELAALAETAQQPDAVQQIAQQAPKSVTGDPERMIRTANASEDDRTRLAVVNQLYLRAGFAPLATRDPEMPLSLDNLETAISQRTHQAPTVTVVMPAYNAEPTIGYAIRCVLEQTWTNLDVIVVDDASTDATAEKAEKAAADDPRVTVIRQPANRGAYAARNAGLAQATGDLVTCHDLDDFSHAQMIQAQVQPLLAYDDLVGTIAHHGRSDPGVRFVTAPWNRMFLKPAYATLMLRRRVFDEIGAWDEGVTGAADGEFLGRVQAFYGKDTIGQVAKGCPLLIALQQDGSLTSRPGTGLSSINSAVGTRNQYREAYLRWHRSETFRDDLPWHPEQRRPFPCPPELAR